MPDLIQYKDKRKDLKGIALVRDKLGRVFRRLVASESDYKCEICGGYFLNRTNDKQIILYCSKKCRRARHRGLQCQLI